MGSADGTVGVLVSTWNLLERLFREEKQYLGNSYVRLQDLERLYDEIITKGKLFDGEIKPDGGLVICQYGFDPSIKPWDKWYANQNVALAFSATDDKKAAGQHAGDPQGSMTLKRNWDGRVVNVPGKPRGDHERMHSAMDRYDVLMQGDVTTTQRMNKRSGKAETVRSGVLHKLAYSPSIGSAEERKMRLVALVTGQDPGPLPRRPQPEVPQPPKSHTPSQGNAADDPFQRGYNDKPETPSSGFRTGQGSQAAKGTYQRSKWYKPGRGLGKDERED